MTDELPTTCSSSGCFGTYLVIAYYFFTPLADPELEMGRHKSFFEGRDILGRIYLSREGINGQISASPTAAQEYMEWLRADERFAAIDFKIHTYHEHVFPRMSVKVRQQLVAMDQEIDLALRGEYLTPQAWKEMLEREDPEKLLLDVRNDYEWEIGHFEGADLPPLKTFREFPRFAERLKNQVCPKKTKVMMYCTGGIRCELYSALLKKEGFEQVYQLQGGVINYGLKEGKKHWKGKLFVFDDRLSVPISDDEGNEEVISCCRHCDQLTDLYYNCANMDCNELFLCCHACAKQLCGCCSQVCREKGRLRPFVPEEKPKPFCRFHLIADRAVKE